MVLLERYFPLSADDWRGVAFLWLAYAGFLFTTTHSSALYLLLAVGSATRRPGPVMFLWRWRVVIDLLVTFPATGSRLAGGHGAGRVAQIGFAPERELGSNRPGHCSGRASCGGGSIPVVLVR